MFGMFGCGWPCSVEKWSSLGSRMESAWFWYLDGIQMNVVKSDGIRNVVGSWMESSEMVTLMMIVMWSFT
jgi:hypothetical protein